MANDRGQYLGSYLSPRGMWLWTASLRVWVPTPSLLVAEAAGEPLEPQPPVPVTVTDVVEEL